MKKFTFILIPIFFSFFSFSQSFDVGLGYGSGSILYLDIGYFAKNNIAYYIEFGTQLPSGVNGENYTSTINWDEMSEDHKSQGDYYSIYDFSVGYKFSSFFIGGVVGYASKTAYRNCYDSYHILGNNGYYYKTTTTGEGELNAGIKAKYFIPLETSSMLISVGLKATTVEGIGINVGFSF